MSILRLCDYYSGWQTIANHYISQCIYCGILLPSKCSHSGSRSVQPIREVRYFVRVIICCTITLNECCVEYINLYNFTRRVPCGVSLSHMHLPWANFLSCHGSARSHGNNWCRIRLFPIPIGDSRWRQRVYNVVSTIGGEYDFSDTLRCSRTEIRKTTRRVSHKERYV